MLESPRRRRRFAVVGGAFVFVTVVILVATIPLRGTSNAFPDTISTLPATLYHPDKVAPVTPAQVALMRTFIKTAVARANLKYAYTIVNRDLKGDLTLKQWLTGNIPVVQYQAENADTAAFVPLYHFRTSALFEVDLIPVGRTQERPELLFFIGMKRTGGRRDGRWLIDYWEPHWQPPVEMALR